MPQAISAVLDSVQKVGSLVPGSPVGVGQAGTPNLAGVTAVSGTGGSTIGGDPSAPRPIATQDTTPGAGIDRKELMAQVRRGLASLMRTGGGKMTIRLRPDHLGELRIRVHTENGVVRVRFETETAGARDAIEQGLNGLKDDLETKGVRVEELRVNHRSEGSGTGGQDQRSADSGAREHRGRHGQPQDADGFPGDNHDQDEHHTPNGAWTELGLDTLA